MNENLKKIIEAGLQAPSGDNCQPWLIKITEQGFDLFNDKNKDTSLYNYNQNASMIALGAFLENANIEASALGMKLIVDLFPEGEQSNLVARLGLQESVATDKSKVLSKNIYRRATNRKKYKKDFPIEIADKLMESSTEPFMLGDLKLRLSTGELKINVLAAAAATNETLVLENEQLHNFLFNHVTWSSKEANSKKIGLFVKTLEMPVPAVLMFKLASVWKRTVILNKFIGLSKIVSKSNAGVYRYSGAFGAIVGKNNSPKDFLLSGSLLQRVWLSATEMGLSMHPLTGIIFLYERLRDFKATQFSDEHRNLINESYQEIANCFGVRPDEHITFLFRIGSASIPSATSPKLSLEDVLIK